jgi:tetratricopeptide (TPR) repeat protein
VGAPGASQSFPAVGKALDVSGTRRNAVRVWLSISLAVLSLSLGCSPRRPTVDVYLDAVMLRELGQNDLAVEKLNAVVAEDPGFALAYSELGEAYESLGEHAKALDAFRQAARLDSWSFKNHIRLAETGRKLGNYPEAASAYARAAELDPKSLDAMLGAAECYLKSGQYMKSVAYCEQAEQAGGQPDKVLPLLAQAREGQKDFDGAIEAYKRLLTLHGSDVNVLLSLGLAYVKAEHYEQAEQTLISVTQAKPDDGAAFRHLGYCLVKRGDVDRAVQMYQKSVELNDNDWEAHRGLGVAYMMKGRQTGDARLQAEALSHWRRSLNIAPDQPKHEALEQLIREQSKLENPLQGLND